VDNGNNIRSLAKYCDVKTTKTAAPSINSWANFRQVNKKQTFREDNFIFHILSALSLIQSYQGRRLFLRRTTLAASSYPGFAHARAQMEFQEFIPQF